MLILYLLFFLCIKDENVSRSSTAQPWVNDPPINIIFFFCELSIPVTLLLSLFIVSLVTFPSSDHGLNMCCPTFGDQPKFSSGIFVIGSFNAKSWIILGPEPVILKEISINMTEVKFLLDFEFKSAFLKIIMEKYFSDASQIILRAFENRAETVCT